MLHINVMTKALRHGLSAQRYVERHPEKRRLSSLGWVHRNKEYNRQYSKQYNRTVQGRYTCLRHKAKSKDLELSITVKMFAEMQQQPCFYCGGSLPETGYGIDRIDSGIGYTPTNCRACCEVCNKAKNDMSEGDFKAWLVKICNHWLNRESPKEQEPELMHCT